MLTEKPREVVNTRGEWELCLHTATAAHRGSLASDLPPQDSGRALRSDTRSCVSVSRVLGELLLLLLLLRFSRLTVTLV